MPETEPDALDDGATPRSTWKKFLYGLNVADRILPIVTAGLVLWALTAARDAQTTTREQRSNSLSITCATIGAVIEQGRKTIIGPPTPPPYEKKLEALGFPPFPVRFAAQKQAAQAYAQGISNVVERQTGFDNVVNANGSLNCDRLSSIAGVKLRKP